MTTPDFIVDVTESDFEYEVLSYSQNKPVVVDFWATWCRPCKTLSPILEQLATEAHGGFRLARVDVDNNPNLALRFSVRSIPTVKAFSEGRVVGEFAGLQPENRVREFISKILPPSPASLAIEKADSFAGQHQWKEAEKIYRSVLETNPEMPIALLGLAKSQLGQGDGHEAHYILRNFPASHLYSISEILLKYSNVLIDHEEGKLHLETDLDVAYNNCIRLAKRGNIPASIDGLLDILRQDKHYRDDKARQTILALLELLGETDPQTRYYRTELASVLF